MRRVAPRGDHGVCVHCEEKNHSKWESGDEKRTHIPCSNRCIAWLAPALSEAYVVPDASTPWEFWGTVSVSEGSFPAPCTAHIVLYGPNDRNDISPPLDHSDVSNLSATIELHGFYGISNSMILSPILAGNISYSSGSFTFHDVSLTHPSKYCQGHLTGVLDEMASPPVLTVSATLWSWVGTDCILSGAVELYQPGSAEVRGPGESDHNPTHY